MKYSIIILALLFVASCKKELNNSDPDYWSSLRIELADELPDLDLSNARRSVNGTTGWLVSIPVITREPVIQRGVEPLFSQKALIIRTDSKGKIIKSKWLSFTGDFKNVRIEASDGKLELQSELVNGYVKAWHPRMFGIASVKEEIVPAPSPVIELGEVIVVGTYHNNNVTTYSTCFMLSAFLDGIGAGGGGTSGNGTSGYYNPNPWAAGGGPSTPVPVTDDPIIVDYENQYANPEINLEKYLKCFEAIPDAGAVCSIKLMTDIPVDGDPSKLFNWENGSPGHAFVQLSKSNAGQRVDQYIGFYPETGWKASANNSAVDSKVVDNSSHEYNASITLSLTPAKLKEVLERIKELAEYDYDIDDYNCADFALDIFNWSQPFANHLTIPLLSIPGGPGPVASSRTPQGIYMKLQSIKGTTDPRASAVAIPLNSNVGTGKGPCR